MKTDIYTKVTDKIIADLEQGNLTWVQPWQASHGAGAITRPLRSCGKAYQGINILMLWASAMERGFDNPIWLTYQQAATLGGQVRKGEQGSPVVYADTMTKKQTDDAGNDSETVIPFLKTYTVFNALQIDGLPERFYTRTDTTMNDHQRIDTADRFVAATHATLRYGGSQAYYNPTLDYIQMPHLAAFRDTESYYATLAHELTHWTSHATRLNRKIGKITSEKSDYAREELVAEIGAAFLCADIGITPETREDHAAYIASWLKVLQQDKRAIFTAAAYAQRAVDFLHGCQLP